MFLFSLSSWIDTLQWIILIQKAYVERLENEDLFSLDKNKAALLQLSWMARLLHFGSELMPFSSFSEPCSFARLQSCSSWASSSRPAEKLTTSSSWPTREPKPLFQLGIQFLNELKDSQNYWLRPDNPMNMKFVNLYEQSIKMCKWLLNNLQFQCLIFK